MGSHDWTLYIGVITAGFAVYTFVGALVGKQVDLSVLSWDSESGPQKSESQLIEISRTLAHSFTLRYALAIQSPSYRKDIEKALLTSKVSREMNVDEFIAIQILWGAFIPGFLTLMNLALGAGLPWILIIALAGFGSYFPRLYCQQKRAALVSQIQVDLPFFTDLLALSTQAGLDFIGAIQRISDKADPKSALAQEFKTVLQDINLGSSRADALKAMADRLDMGEMNSFTAIIIDADGTGGSISKVLKDQSEQMRLERFVRAEKAGARASQLILVPMMIFIMPAVFIMVLGPMFLSFLGGGTN